MSKITNPEIEHSVTCGFYNSLGDRKYDAVQMSMIFDGIIKDGIFASIGSCFVVKAGTGNTVKVGSGKCWFNHTWTQNDAVLPVECSEADVLLNRIDAIVIRIDSSDAVRDNFIVFKEGVASSSPVRPTMENSEYVHEYPLCYITRKANSSSISQSNITNMVGTDETPFITGILQTVSLDQLLGQWETELDEFVASEKSDMDEFMSGQENEYNSWFSDMKTLMAEAVDEVDTWTNAQKSTILAWFDNMKDQLSEDAAVNLQNQIDKNDVIRMLLCGLRSGTKTISEDGTVITHKDYKNRTLTKTFSDNFAKCTSVLTDEFGTKLGELIKEFSSDGFTIKFHSSALGDDELDIDLGDGDVDLGDLPDINI